MEGVEATISVGKLANENASWNWFSGNFPFHKLHISTHGKDLSKTAIPWTLECGGRVEPVEGAAEDRTIDLGLSRYGRIGPIPPHLGNGSRYTS